MYLAPTKPPLSLVKVESEYKVFYREVFGFGLRGDHPYVTCACGREFGFNENLSNPNLKTYAHCPYCGELYYLEETFRFQSKETGYKLIRPKINATLFYSKDLFLTDDVENPTRKE